MLEIKNLTVKCNDKIILDNLSLDIEEGKTHVVMGPNGAGKSTLGKVILSSSEYTKSSGKILFLNEDITNLTTYEIARKKIFLLSQMPPAIEGVTNFDLLKSVTKTMNENFSLLEFNEKLEEICKQLEIPSSYIYRDVNVGFSGGERKKNELLHMWMLEPKFIIIDEIDSGLDIDALKTVINSLKEYKKLYNPSILIITHRFDILEEIKPDKVHILKNGKIVSEGKGELINKVISNGYNWTNGVTG